MSNKLRRILSNTGHAKIFNEAVRLISGTVRIGDEVYKIEFINHVEKDFNNGDSEANGRESKGNCKDV